MSENTQKQGCTDWEWEAAREAGLLTSVPGSTKQEQAIHRFAEMVRNQLKKKVN